MCVLIRGGKCIIYIMKIIFIDFTNIRYETDTPLNEPLGGTQSSVCYLTKYLAMNNDVYLFNNNDKISVKMNVKIYPNTMLDKILEIKPDVIVNVNVIEFDLLFLMRLKELGTVVLTYYQHYIDQPGSIKFKDVRFVGLIDGYIFVSNFQKNKFIDMFKLSERKCYVLMNGIGDPFKEFLTKEQKKEKVITYCSTPFRGLSLLLDIYPKVKEKYKDLKMKIFSGMNLYQQENDMETLEIQDKLSKLEDVVVKQGVSQIELAKELENVMILSYPNIFIETSCITALQCMAAGCIILTSDLGALKETTYDNNFLVKFDGRDIEGYIKEYTKKLEYIIENYDMLEEVIRKNKEKILSNHLWEKISLDFIKICEDVKDKKSKYTINTEKIIELKEKEKNIINRYKILTGYEYFNDINGLYNYLIEYGVLVYYVGKTFTFNDKGKLMEALKIFKKANSIIESEDTLRNIVLLMKELEMDDKMISYVVKYNKYNFDFVLNSDLSQYYTRKGFNNAASSITRNIMDLGIMYGPENNYITDKEKYLDSRKEMYNKLEKIIDVVPIEKDKNIMISNILLSGLYEPDVNGEKHYDLTMRTISKLHIDDKLIELGKNWKFRKNEKVRVGYFIPNTIYHPCSYMITKILKYHNRDKFEIFGIDYLKEKSSEIKLSDRYNIQYINIMDKSDEEALKMILDLNLDILVDMAGHTNLSRISLLKCKPARIIINYFAYPATYGIPEVNYKIADIHACPKSSEKYFVEKILRMPEGFQCYNCPFDIKLNKEMDYTKINFCCFNNPKKFSRKLIEIYSIIIKRVPNSKLYISHPLFDCNHLIKYYYSEFSKYGIKEDKLSIMHEGITQYLELYNKMHIALDPFPYNGGTISHEALYMNTPLVTIEGDTYVSRVGVSLLRNLGYHELIGKGINEYIEIAVKLAGDKERMKMYHTSIRERMEKTDLLNGETFVKHLEEKYSKILEEKRD